MKFVARVLLLLCILVVGRYGYLHANIGSNSIACSFKPIEQHSKNSPKLKAIEISEEDDEPTSFKKKLLNPGNYFSSFTYALPVAYSTYIANARLSSCKYFNYSSSPKYIFYGVLRI